jgi:hypothetical protein
VFPLVVRNKKKICPGFVAPVRKTVPFHSVPTLYSNYYTIGNLPV